MDDEDIQGTAGQYKSVVTVPPVPSVEQGMVEMSNLVSNPGSVPGADVPAPQVQPGIKRVESSDLLNLTLHQCARNGDVRSTQILLGNMGGNIKKKINVLDEDDLTPLHYAARYNHLQVMKLLVDNHADINARDEEGLTPLHFAARFKRGKQKLDQEVEVIGEDGTVASSANGLPVSESADELGKQRSAIQFFISRNADVNVQDNYGQTPLHYAAMRGNDVACSELLACKGIQIEATDKQGMTALHMAATHNRVEIAKLLVERGANLRCTDEEQSTPLHGASTEGNIAIVKLLFEAGAKLDGWVTIHNMVTDEDIDGNTCLSLAVENGHYEVVKLCLEKRADVNTPNKNFMHPLHNAAVNGDVRILRLLVEHKARIDPLNDEQMTPLHKAAQYNHTACVEFLVDRGAEIERRDEEHYTPLLLAAVYGRSETVDLLIRKRADFSAVDQYDKTAVFLAAEEDKLDCLETLLKNKNVEDLISVGDRYDNTPLHIAAEKGFVKIAKCLLDNGADLDCKNEEEQSPLHLAARHGRTNIVRELVSRDKNIVNDEDENSNSALHLAALYGHNKLANVLIEMGADVSARNCSLWTPLDCAAAKGWAKTAKVLLDADSPIDPMDKAKTTPLHLASRYGFPKVVKLLIEWDADVQQRDSDGNNCLDLAIDNYRPEVAEVILGSWAWQDALRNHTIDLNTGRYETPMRKLIRKMPEVAEKVFNHCMEDNKLNMENMDYEITFNYEFLDDLYSLLNWTESGSSEVGSSSGSMYDDEGHLTEKARPYTTDSNRFKKNHPLMLMVTSKREDLLAHPLVTALLRQKWNKFGRTFYYGNFIIYAIFLTFLTGYIVTTDPPYHSHWENKTCERYAVNGESQHLFAKIGKYVVIALAAWNLLRELLQLYQAKLNYLGWENLIEWITYVTALLTVIDFYSCQQGTGYREVWQWHLGTIAIVLAWIDLVLFAQKFPRFGIYVVMFKDIMNTFMQFFLVFLLFIIAFAMGFYCLLQNQEPFETVWQSLIKTSVMMIGEFEFDSIYNTEEEIVHYEAIAYILFVVFMIVMSIIIMNLLVGLAVDNIKEVQEQAALKRMAMQVELALDVERIVPDFIRRRVVTRKESIKPNQAGRTVFSRIFGLSSYGLTAATISKALNPELDEIEKVQESQVKLQKSVDKLKVVVKEMREQNSKIEGMLQAIISSQKVSYDEEDYQEEEED